MCFAWLRNHVSISRLTPWQRRRSFTRRPISSKNRLCGLVILKSPGRFRSGRTFRQWRSGAHCSRPELSSHTNKSGCHFPFPQSYRTSAPSKDRINRIDKETFHFDHHIAIPTKDGRVTTFITHPRARRPAPLHHLLHGRAAYPHDCGHAADSPLGLLGDAAENPITARADVSLCRCRPNPEIAGAAIHAHLMPRSTFHL